MAVATHCVENITTDAFFQQKLITLSISADDDGNNEGDRQDFFSAENVRRRFMSGWASIRYGFNVQYKPAFSDAFPIWFFGWAYHSKDLEDSRMYANDDNEIHIRDFSEFFRDFSSLIWITYRKNFCALHGSSLTSDGGWGCMLRSGQMVLANALLIHLLQSGWRRAEQGLPGEKNCIYRVIIGFFNDEDANHSPFSLHKLVHYGKRYDKKPGDWYGPASVAGILNFAVENASHPALDTFCLYVAQDSTIYMTDVLELCTQCKNCNTKSCSETFQRAVLILVPLRLGIEELNITYIPCLKSLMALESCVGIIGGRPNHSLYIVGFQDKKLIYLDPHYVQNKVDMRSKDFPVESFHCQYPRTMAFERMDPSCTIGFYCRNEFDFNKFCTDAAAVLKHPAQKMDYPMFSFSNAKDSKRCYEFADSLSSGFLQSDVESAGSWSEVSRSKQKHVSRSRKAPAIEEYVIIG